MKIVVLLGLSSSQKSQEFRGCECQTHEPLASKQSCTTHSGVINITSFHQRGNVQITAKWTATNDGNRSVSVPDLIPRCFWCLYRTLSISLDLEKQEKETRKTTNSLILI